MYSVCTRIEMIIFNKRGERLPSPFYKLLLMCRVYCPEVLAGAGNTLGTHLGLGNKWAGASGAGLGAACPAGLSWGHHAADQGTTERRQQRWGSLCSVHSASQLVR